MIEKATCRAKSDPKHNDGLDGMVAALPLEYRRRFGGIVWAQGGPGFGWWPSYIYDPSKTIDKNVRTLAMKHLGKRHLVYFFQCIEASFDVLPEHKIAEWDQGIAENYHLGKAARTSGKNRAMQFEEALKVAALELAKPPDQRMDWNRPILPVSPKKLPVAPQGKAANKASGKKRRASAAAVAEPKAPYSNTDRAGKGKASRRDKGRKNKGQPGNETDDDPTQQQVAAREGIGGAAVRVRDPHIVCRRTNLMAALAAHDERAAIELDETLYSTIILGNSIREGHRIGFVKLPSRSEATFTDVRVAIERDLESDLLPPDRQWRFCVPTLGQVSTSQEVTLGPLVKFLQDTSIDATVGDGSSKNPLRVLISTV